MKIWDGIPKSVIVYEGPKGVKKTEKTGNVASKRDELSISSQAKDIRQQ